MHAFENGMDDVAAVRRSSRRWLKVSHRLALSVLARCLLPFMPLAAQRSPSQKTGYFLVFDDWQLLASSWSQHPPWWLPRLQYLSIEVS